MFIERADFLSPKAFATLLDWSKTAEFHDTKSDVDGVTYPEICDTVPDIVRQEVAFVANREPNALFLRRSPKGVRVPNQVHTDNSMGMTSLMLYLQDLPEPETPGVIAGTSFLRHRITGVAYAPMLEELVRICREDSNYSDRWLVHSRCEMQANKACIFDAGWFHRAEPIGGFGEGLEARCVLTGFFP